MRHLGETLLGFVLLLLTVVTIFLSAFFAIGDLPRYLRIKSK
jgi:hypothetical protein